MGATVGIDLGTTNCVVARLDGRGIPTVVPNAEGKAITPSVICFRGHEILVGDAAKELQALGEWPIAAFFKRQMGDPLFLLHANGNDYPAMEPSTTLLKKLKADAEDHLGDKDHNPVNYGPALLL